jgi:4'-phosphopantetheinyl transferase
MAAGTMARMNEAPPQPSANLTEPLGDDEVHVWRLAYASDQGRRPLCQVLAAYLGVQTAQVILAEDGHGRPRLAGPLEGALHFNWTHSGDRALVAVARHVQPGIDLERIRPRPRALEIARRYFSAAETRLLESTEASARELVFLRLWTGKEALLKALGRGLAFGLHRLTLALDGDSLRLEAFEEEDPAHWQLHVPVIDRGYVAAVAWRGGPMRVLAFPPALGATLP